MGQSSSDRLSLLMIDGQAKIRRMPASKGYIANIYIYIYEDDDDNNNNIFYFYSAFGGQIWRHLFLSCPVVSCFCQALSGNKNKNSVDAHTHTLHH